MAVVGTGCCGTLRGGPAGERAWRDAEVCRRGRPGAAARDRKPSPELRGARAAAAVRERPWWQEARPSSQAPPRGPVLPLAAAGRGRVWSSEVKCAFCKVTLDGVEGGLEQWQTRGGRARRKVLLQGGGWLGPSGPRAASGRGNAPRTLTTPLPGCDGHGLEHGF